MGFERGVSPRAAGVAFLRRNKLCAACGKDFTTEPQRMGEVTHFEVTVSVTSRASLRWLHGCLGQGVVVAVIKTDMSGG
jgi:hypothetical protein